MRVFLSWSGQRSKAVASGLRDWLPDVLQSVVPFMSSEDIPKGAQWASTLDTELKIADFAIICVTNENRDKPWLNYEAGALSNALTSPNVCPVLLDLTSSDIAGPLATFQMAQINEADMRQLVETLNSKLPSPLSESQVHRAFQRCWPDLEAKVKAIESAPPHDSTTTAKRSVEDLAKETLDAVREQARSLTAIHQAIGLRFRSVANLASVLHEDRFYVSPGDVVRHPKWGQGTVVNLVGAPNDGLATIDFPRVGRKMVMLKYAPLELVATRDEVKELKWESADAEAESGETADDGDEAHDAR